MTATPDALRGLASALDSHDVYLSDWGGNDYSEAEFSAAEWRYIKAEALLFFLCEAAEDILAPEADDITFAAFGKQVREHLL